jgi:hypothetical protein
MSRDIDLSSYIDVAARIVEFRSIHPGGSLQPADLSQPYRVESIGDQTYIVVVAAAYRSAYDARPGIGMAYEVFPGRTQFTRGSELQNAETSAWGRAIVAALAADTKRGIASAEEVRNRRAEDEDWEAATPATAGQVAKFDAFLKRIGECATADEVKALGAEIHLARSANDISDVHYRRLAQAGTERIAELDKPAEAPKEES